MFRFLTPSLVLLRIAAGWLASVPWCSAPAHAAESEVVWVAVGDRRFVSGDGARWEEAHSASDQRGIPPLASVVHGLGGFLAVTAGSAPGELLRSVDGRVWTRLKADAPRVASIAFGNNRFFAAATGRVLVSTDGEHFFASDRLELPSSVIPGKSVYGSGEGGPRYVLLGETEGAGPRGRSYWRAASESGETWLSTAVSSEPAVDITYGGGQFVVVGPGGLIESSQDGQIWQRHPADPAADFSRVVWTGKRFIASASTGLWSSQDGRTWERDQTGAPGILAWADDALPLSIALGWSGDLYLNRDGKNWQKAGLPGAPLLRAISRGH